MTLTSLNRPFHVSVFAYQGLQTKADSSKGGTPSVWLGRTTISQILTTFVNALSTSTPTRGTRTTRLKRRTTRGISSCKYFTLQSPADWLILPNRGFRPEHKTDLGKLRETIWQEVRDLTIGSNKLMLRIGKATTAEEALGQPGAGDEFSRACIRSLSDQGDKAVSMRLGY